MSTCLRFLSRTNNVKRLLRFNHIRSKPTQWLNRQQFCTKQPPKKQSGIRKWIKRGLTGIFCGVSGLTFFLYIRHRDEKNWQRSMKFWRHVYPLYFAYKSTDIRTKNWPEEKRDAKFEELHEKYKYKIVDIIDELRGLYIKMGQMGASNIGNMYPKSWVEALRKFEDDCPYEPIERIHEIICAEYGLSNINEMFVEIGEKPLGAASIGQCHYAKLKNGEEVVIKIQYPDAEELFRGDLLLARKFCEMAQPEHLAYLDEMEAQFLTEFDYSLEADNLEEIGNNLNESPLWKDKVIVPRPYRELCTKNCLIMQYLKGKKFVTALMDNFGKIAKERGQTVDEFIEEQKAQNFHPTAEELRNIRRQIEWRDYIWNMLGFMINNSFGFVFSALGNANGRYIVEHKETTIPLNIKYYLDLIASVHGYELFINGAFNGDPHPGNILVLDDGRLGLIDYGQVKHLDVESRIKLAKLMIYLKRNDTQMIIKQVENMGLKTQNMDPWVFEKVGRFYFDCDSMEVTDGMNMLLFMEYIDKRDPALVKADDYVFPARLRMLISGLHWSLGYSFKASDSWSPWAQQLLDENGFSVFSIMGIKGLTKLIQQHASDSFKESHIKSYFGRAIALDATMALYQFLIAVRHGADGLLTNDAGETTSHVIGFFYRTIRMMENGVKPIWIFDGKPPDFKQHELAQRKEKRDKADAELKEAEEAGDKEQIVKFQKRTTKVTREHVKDVQQLLTLMGVPWYAAPGEAEAQASSMCAEGIVYGAGTEDMDALTFGTTKLVRRLTDSAARKTPVLEFDLKKVLQGLDVTMAQFIDICILCGCDYCPSIRGIGPKKAYAFIKQYDNIEGVIESLKNQDRYKIPENWQYKESRELFVNPDVTKKEDLPKFKWELPKDKELTAFLVEKMSFNMDRVQTAIERLKKCKKKSSQKRLDSFFKMAPPSSSKRKKKETKLTGNKRKRGNDENVKKPANKKRKTQK